MSRFRLPRKKKKLMSNSSIYFVSGSDVVVVKHRGWCRELSISHLNSGLERWCKELGLNNDDVSSTMFLEYLDTQLFSLKWD
jgi:hypothetical protein